MSRKIGISSAGKSLPARKTCPKNRKAEKIVSRQKIGARPEKARTCGRRDGRRPPPPGQGKRGEQGYLAYLLRQAHAATRLTMERALADVGVTPPQFVVLTMLRAYPGLSGAELARVALLTPQTVGVIIGNLERDRAIRKTRASRPRPDAAMEPDAARRRPPRKMPAARHGGGTAAGGRPLRQSAGDSAALAVQNRHRFAGLAGCRGVLVLVPGKLAAKLGR